MNRRGFFVGAVAAPIAVAVARPKPTAKAFVCGTPQCSECLSVMAMDDDAAATVKANGTATIRCLNSRCEQFKKGLRFAVPTVQAIEEREVLTRRI